LVTDAQVRKLMSELSKHGKIGRAAMRAAMDRKTARRYRDLGCVPSKEPTERTWLTRPDVFEEDWPRLAAMLEDAPELEAKSLLEFLMSTRPGRYGPSQLRTLQRRVRRWLAAEGPGKRVFFQQNHRPGEALQTDFTWATEFAITIGGVPFTHMLCHVALPFSNWSWATVCLSESMSALKRGLQAAVQRLGGVTEWHQTDNSTAATHRLDTGKRDFNDDYDKLIKHLGMKARTIQVGKKEQNGDIEALNGAMKRKVEQHLLLRASRDFESVRIYETWLLQIFDRSNAMRGARLSEELAVLRSPPTTWLPEYVADEAWVSPWSTIRVAHNTYSVPSRLIGETVPVRVHDDRIEVWYAGQLQLTIERLRGRNGHRVDYRHVIWSLVRKPGAFARYKYREDLFPTLIFRRTYDALLARLDERKADIEYLRILHLAASTMQSDVEPALAELLDTGTVFSADVVKQRIRPAEHDVPEMEVPPVVLGDYDMLHIEMSRELDAMAAAVTP
jgi:transposase InsO family protein